MEALRNNKCVGTCLIDLEKAFDSVWIEGLIYKLTKKEFPISTIKTIISMIMNRKFHTSLGNNLSDKEYKVKNGLQQGTVNSPLLFNIYTADVLRLFGAGSNTNTKAIAFADDLVIYTTDTCCNIRVVTCT